MMTIYAKYAAVRHRLHATRLKTAAFKCSLEPSCAWLPFRPNGGVRSQPKRPVAGTRPFWCARPQVRIMHGRQKDAEIMTPMDYDPTRAAL